MVRFYKLLVSDLCHNGFTYKEGLNVDPVPFDPSGDCRPGGLYYTDFEHIPRWCFARWPLIADVSVPDDARVYAEPCGTKWKADRLELSNIRPLREFLAAFDEDTLRGMLTRNGLLLQHVPNQTDALCLAAVQNDGMALIYVDEPHQTDAINLVAVQQNGWILKYVRKQTDAICLAAVQQNGYALYHVRCHTDAICLAAVQHEGLALEYVDATYQTEENCMAAVRQNPYALEYMHYQTEAVCRAAVERKPDVKRFVKIPINF